MKDRIRRTRASIGVDEIRKAVRSISTRIRKYIDAQGHHFKHLPYRYVSTVVLSECINEMGTQRVLQRFSLSFLWCDLERPCIVVRWMWLGKPHQNLDEKLYLSV